MIMQNTSNFKKLSKNQMKSILGGFHTGCRFVGVEGCVLDCTVSGNSAGSIETHCNADENCVCPNGVILFTDL